MAILGFMHTQDLLTNNYTSVADKIPNGRVKPGVLAAIIGSSSSAYRQESFYKKFMLKPSDPNNRFFSNYNKFKA